MATWPASGNTDWNVKMLAYLAIGHDTDGTHKKSQMLTDMGWSPTSYTGGESITLPNGFIFKQGTASSINAGDTLVTFGDAFPTGITNAWSTWREVVSNDIENCGVHTMLVGSMKLRNPNSGWSGRTINWFAIGY